MLNPHIILTPEEIEDQKRTKPLFAALEAGDLMTVYGVTYAYPIQPAYCRAVPLYGSSFCLVAWKCKSCGKLGTLRTELLWTRTRLNENEGVATAEKDRLQKLIQPHSVVELRVRLAKQTPMNRPEALLIEAVGPYDGDAELNAFAENLRKPVCFEDETFGTFELDRTTNNFGLETKWGSGKASLYLESPQVEGAKKLLQTAHALHADWKTWDRKLRGFAADEMLELHKDWANEDEGNPEVTRAQFIRKMSVESVSIQKGGKFEVWYYDGEMFGGHAITVYASLEKGPTKAEMNG